MKTSRRLTLLLWLALVAVMLPLALQVRINTDMRAFLPLGGGAEEKLLLDQLQHGSSTRMLLMAIDGEDRRLQARLSSALATSLRRSGRFERVLNGEFDLSAAPESPWFEYRYLLQDTDFSVEGLRRALQQRLQELRSPLGLYLRRSLAADPTAAYRKLLRNWQGDAAPQRLHGVWFSADGRALLLAQTNAAGFDLDAQQGNLEGIRSAFAGLAGSASARLELSGAPAIAVASRETIRSEARTASLVASLAVALILLLAYRSWRLWLLGALPLALAMLTAVTVTALLFGSIHGITLAFGIIVLGVAIDYPIHLFSHLAPGQSPREGLHRIWPTLRLGVLSTAIGFAALLFTRFDGLVQLGAFAVSGLLMAALATRYLLPALLPPSWAGREYGRSATVSVVSGRAGLAAILLLLPASLVWLWQGGGKLWETDLAALSPVPEAQRQLDGELRRVMQANDVNRLLLLSAADPESLLQAEERLQPRLDGWVAEGLLGGYELASRWLPSARLQRERQQQLPSAKALEQRLARAGEGLPFRNGAFRPFVEAVQHSREQAPLTPARVADTAAGLPLQNLLLEQDGRWWGIVQLAGVADEAALRRHVEQAEMGLRYVDLKRLTGDLLLQFRDSALHNLAWGVLAIVLLLASSGCSLRRMGQVLLPLTTALALTLALLHGLGERLTLFHLVALLLVAGIGIDYGLFFSRRESGGEQGHTRHALTVCAISTMTVFAILSLSRLPVLHAIGLTVLIGVAASYWLARLMGSIDTGDTGESSR